MAEPGASETVDLYLHVCPECGSGLVQPTGWQQEGDRSQWRVWRRCPECEWDCEGVHNEREIDVFDQQLDHGAQQLASQLRLLEHENMSEMTDAFIVAIWSDLITADDFA